MQKKTPKNKTQTTTARNAFVASLLCFIFFCWLASMKIYFTKKNNKKQKRKDGPLFFYCRSTRLFVRSLNRRATPTTPKTKDTGDKRPRKSFLFFSLVLFLFLFFFFFCGPRHVSVRHGFPPAHPSRPRRPLRRGFDRRRDAEADADAAAAVPSPAGPRLTAVCRVFRRVG